MLPTESEVLTIRLARMKYLIDALEAACAVTEEQRQAFLKLKAEMAAARETLKAPRG